jgi:hypothetical protein
MKIVVAVPCFLSVVHYTSGGRPSPPQVTVRTSANTAKDSSLLDEHMLTHHFHIRLESLEGLMILQSLFSQR